jgi:hypothetical protein
MTETSLRVILAKNLLQMIQADGQSLRAWAIAKGLDVRMIDRLSKGENAVTLDKIDEIAKACGLQAWQLLLEDLDHKAPADAPISQADRDLLGRLRNLLDKDVKP